MPNGFTVNAHRFDPYKNFKFHVYCDGRLVMGVSKVGALKRTSLSSFGGIATNRLRLVPKHSWKSG